MTLKQKNKSKMIIVCQFCHWLFDRLRWCVNYTNPNQQIPKLVKNFEYDAQLLSLDLQNKNESTVANF